MRRVCDVAPQRAAVIAAYDAKARGEHEADIIAAAKLVDPHDLGRSAECEESAASSGRVRVAFSSGLAACCARSGAARRGC